MVKILYEDSEILVAEKPAGMESQSSRGFEPDMVSEIKNYLACRAGREGVAGRRGISTKLSPSMSTEEGGPYVGVIHRLDKPVAGVMVYAKTRSSAAVLSRAVQEHRVTKIYHAVVCGKPVDNVGNFVDNLYMDREKNYSSIVDKSKKGGKQAELSYRVIGRPREETLPDGRSTWLSLLEIELKTGRHHQIRVQLAGHGLPLWGDTKYNSLFGGILPGPEPGTGGREGKSGAAAARRSLRAPLALAAVRLGFAHPVTGEWMEFSMEPRSGAFRQFAAEVRLSPGAGKEARDR